MEEPSPVIEPQPEVSQARKMSLASRLLNVLAAPGEVFDEVKVSPPSSANWLVPALLLILVSWVGAAMVLSQDSIRHQLTEMTDKAIQKQIETKHVPEAQAEQMRKVGGIGYKVSIFAGPVFVAFASPFFWGLILWLGGKVLKGNFGYMKAVEVVGLGNMLVVLEAIVKTLLIIVTGSVFAAPSLTLLVKDFNPENTAHGLLGLVNIMLFWILAVRAIGLARLTNRSFGKAAAWVFGIWAAYTGLLLGFGLAMKAIFSR